MSNTSQASGLITWSNFAKADDLQKRLWFTLFALIVYRFGSYVPLPGIDPIAISELFNRNRSGILGLFDLFSGGSLGRMTVFALNVVPYISASIIMQLMVAVVPSLNQIKKDGESGRRTINQYTRYLTVVLTTFQGMAIAFTLESLANNGAPVVIDPGFLFRLTTVTSLVGGTLFLMWLGEQITARGIGNGISLIIFSGIVASLPAAVVAVLELGRTGVIPVGGIILLIILVVLAITLIVFVERAQRRILVQYPKRQIGMRVTSGDSSHLPLRINSAGVIPPIFATSLLFLPASLGSFSGDAISSSSWLTTLNAMLGRGQPLYLFIYASLIVIFSYVYTSLIFNPQETSENLRKNGGIIPGIRPGEATTNYLDFVLTRLTVIGSMYLVLICLLPEFLITKFAVPFYFGGTSLLIVVSVTMDTVSRVQGHLYTQHYEKLMKSARLGKR